MRTDCKKYDGGGFLSVIDKVVIYSNSFTSIDDFHLRMKRLFIENEVQVIVDRILMRFSFDLDRLHFLHGSRIVNIVHATSFNTRFNSTYAKYKSK